MGNAHYSKILIVDNESLHNFIVVPDTSTTPQIDVPSSRYGHGCTDFDTNFDTYNYHCYDFRDGAETSRSPQVSKIPRVSEVQAQVETDAHAATHIGEGVDNFDCDTLNDAYESDEMDDSGDDYDNDLQPADDIPQNTPFYGKNVPFLYNLQDRLEVYISIRESEDVGCKVWLHDKESDLKSEQLFSNKEILKTTVKLWNLRVNREFTVWESKKDYWTIKCKRRKSGCDRMLKGQKTPINL
ncbi:hypothetical protein HAX54_027767 [Datura stramonium]|uniref:Transposase MuDR plant domain-containing protein n=1 Tax=Datura stramonium TaxID=4076 RepID=A0ABS8S905_DATST|nr:hypothetical protein [Datura stramonium]